MSLFYIFSALWYTLVSVQADDVYPCDITTAFPPTVFGIGKCLAKIYILKSLKKSYITPFSGFWTLYGTSFWVSDKG